MHHKLNGYWHENIAACKFTPVFRFCTSFLEVFLLFFTIHLSHTLNLHRSECIFNSVFYCHHKHQQSNNSMQFISIIVPTLLPDGLNLETQIKRNIIGTHIEQRIQKQNTWII